jgi:hypothetical protein
MWLSAIKLAVSAGSHIYKNKQQTKMLMSDAAMKHAQKDEFWRTRVFWKITRS